MAYIYNWSSAVDGDDVIKLERYETAEDLLCAMWQCDIEDLKKSKHGGFDGNGKEYEYSYDDLIRSLKIMGCYGFADSKKKIHFWVDINVVDPIDFIGMIAHEKGHMTRPFHKDEMKEEIKAERYGDAASFAFQIYKDVFLTDCNCGVETNIKENK